MRNLWITGLVAVVAATGIMTMETNAQETKPKNPGYTDTPMLPGDKWHVHDPSRPSPPVVTPGTPATAEPVAKAPSDAIVLFDGTDLSKFRNGKGEPAGWIVENGYMQVPPKESGKGGDIYSREEFGDCQLHIEWMAPNPPKGDSQGRGNSGVFMMGRYEIQVLDSYENPTYADGSASSLYGTYPPLVNASRKPGEWQTYDILWTAPRFDGDKVVTPAYVTILHNGVVVHNHQELMGASGHKTVAKYVPHGPAGPLKLQDHNDPVRFRNIWVRPIKGYDQP